MSSIPNWEKILEWDDWKLYQTLRDISGNLDPPLTHEQVNAMDSEEVYQLVCDYYEDYPSEEI